MITIAIADDQLLVREGFKLLLSTDSTFRIVGEAADGLAAVELAEKLKPKVLLLELNLPRMHGLAAIRRVRSTTKTQVVVVTTQSSTCHIAECLLAGAAGYILKDDSPHDLFSAIKDVATGEPFISPRLRKAAFAAALGSSREPGDSYSLLTERERAVLLHSAKGFTNAQIGRKLFISHRTVESHRAQVMKKLSLESQTDLVRYAIRRKIVSP